MFSKKSIFVLSLFFILFCITVFSGNIEFEDSAGRQVKLDKTAERIVDLTFLDGVRTLIELEASDKLVGMSEMDHHAFMEDGPMKDMYIIVSKVAPELKNIVNVGSHKEPNVETIISLNPDVIFMGWSRKEYADTLQGQTGVPVVCVGGYGEFNYSVFDIVGKVVGKEERAAELVSFLKSKLKIVTDVTDKIPEDQKKKIFYLVRPYIGDPRTNGRYQAFEIAGGINVASRGKVIPYGVYKITSEQILAWNPDFIFRHSSNTRDIKGLHTLETVCQDKIMKMTSAVKNGNVFNTKGHLRGWDIATESVEVFYLAKILYPELFEDMDVESMGNEILEKFYGLPGLYTEMSELIRLYTW